MIPWDPRAAVPALVIAATPAAVSAQGFAVGHTTIPFSDPARAGRSVPTEIYYPADTPGTDVPVALGADELPVVAFGHGFLMAWSAYQYVWDGLVPDGFVVAFPTTEGGFLPSHQQFGLDLAFVISALQAEAQNPASLFFGKIGSTSAVSGHSMGGGASVLAAAASPGITAVANLAAAETTPSAIAAASQVAAPALLFAGTDDCVTPVDVHQRPIHDALASECRALLEVEGGSHCQFAGSNFNCSLGEIGCAPPGISRSAQNLVVLDFVRPWLAWQLRGDTTAGQTFQMSVAQDPRITADSDCGAVASPLAGLAAGTNASFRLRLVQVPSPNPFRTGTNMAFELVEGGPAVAEVVDVTGRRVRVLLDKPLAAGRHLLTWDGRSATAGPVPAGTYYVRLRAGGEAVTAPTVRIR